MAKFNLDNYETVEDRLKKYWEENPHGKIETDVVHITDDGNCVPHILGCMEEMATNYNPDATQDDQSCKFPEEEPPI